MGTVTSEQRKEAGEPLFSLMEDEFAAAERAVGVLHQDLLLAGRHVCLRLAGEAVTSWIWPALGHLAAESASGVARFQTDLFVRARTDSGSPAGSSRASTDADRITTSAGGRFVRQRVGGIDCLLDRQERYLIGSISSMDDVPSWERAKPLALPLTVWLSDEGIDVVHAGLVACAGEGVLFTGSSGMGKSTCALACASAGFDFLGDDCILLDLAGDVGVGHSLYATAALEVSHLKHVCPRESVPAAIAASPGKVLVSPRGTEGVPGSVCSRIRAIVLPRIAHTDHSLLRPARKADALRSIAVSSIVKRAVPAQRTLARLAGLVNRVPSYHLDMGCDPSDIPFVIAPLVGPGRRL